jgi:hypothetical protein
MSPGALVGFVNVHGDWVHHEWAWWAGGGLGGWVCESGSLLMMNQIWW